MLPLLAYATSVAAGYILGNKVVAPNIDQQVKKIQGKQLLTSTRTHSMKNNTVEILHEDILEESSVILTTEDIPLDNRFGSEVLISEHEFTRTADVTMRIDQGQNMDELHASNMWGFLSSEAEEHINHAHNIHIGSQTTRKISLKLSVGAGESVCYRVVWKQNVSRGSIKLKAGQTIMTLPYSVTFGLFHSVESIIIDKTPKIESSKTNQTSL